MVLPASNPQQPNSTFTGQILFLWYSKTTHSLQEISIKMCSQFTLIATLPLLAHLSYLRLKVSPVVTPETSVQTTTQEAPGQCLSHLHSRKIKANEKGTLSLFQTNSNAACVRRFLWFSGGIPYLQTLCTSLTASTSLLVCTSPHAHCIESSSRAGIMMKHFYKFRLW